MEILKDEDIHLRFLLGLPVYIEGIGELRSPLLKDIVKMTESKYTMAVSSLLFKKNMLDIDSKETDQYSDFQVLSALLYRDIAYREIFFSGLELHFGKRPLMHEEGFIYFDELSEDNLLTEDKFNYIKRLTTIANNIKNKDEDDEIIAGNERARKFLEEQKKRKAQLAKLKKPKVNLRSIISAVGWEARNFDFINNLNIYQLYDGLGRYQLRDNYHHTMDGIYAGTIDGSKIKMEDINWANILNT